MEIVKINVNYQMLTTSDLGYNPTAVTGDSSDAPRFDFDEEGLF